MDQTRGVNPLLPPFKLNLSRLSFHNSVFFWTCDLARPLSALKIPSEIIERCFKFVNRRGIRFFYRSWSLGRDYDVISLYREATKKFFVRPGFTDSQLHPTTDSWVHPTTDSWLHPTTDSWFHPTTDSWLHPTTDSHLFVQNFEIKTILILTQENTIDIREMFTQGACYIHIFFARYWFVFIFEGFPEFKFKDFLQGQGFWYQGGGGGVITHH